MSEPQLNAHPAAEVFPLIDGEEFEALVEDIRANGLRESIVRDQDGLILDGRNRARACARLGITPTYRFWNQKGTPEEFVFSMNLHRRHLTSEQRAAIAAKYSLPALEKKAKKRQKKHGGTAPGKPNTSGKSSGSDQGESVQQAATLAKTNAKYVRAARDLGKKDPKALDDVIAGKVTLKEATGKTKKKKPAANGNPIVPAGCEVAGADAPLPPHRRSVAEQPPGGGRRQERQVQLLNSHQTQEYRMDNNHVVVTTKHRGVFFGRLVEDRQETVVLAEARNCTYWSRECRGFIGLAVSGPIGDSKVGPAAPSLTLYGVTSLTACTPEAVKAWEAGPWK